MEKQEWYHASAAARFLGVSVATIRLHADAGRLPATRSVDGARLFTRKDLEAYRLAREQVSTKKARR